METASLRIRFTPFFNNALKNGSKFCLEIVPEVSCIENLDKISWKQEKDLIEYTIPMTYKIILKKQETPKNVHNDIALDVVELDKIYHSCVDLLPTSSMTPYTFASGDITKIISDTYILGKLSTKYADDKHVLDNPVTAIEKHVIKTQSYDFNIEHEHVISNYVLNKDNKSDNAITRQVINTTTSSESVVNSGDRVSKPSEGQCFVYNYSLDKITNTEHAATICKITETQSNDMIEISAKSREDPKRMLSLSPICSINTNDKSDTDYVQKLPLNLIVNQTFQYDTREIYEDIAFKLPTRSQKHVHIKTLNEMNNISEEKLYRVYIRELPEEKVAKFIKKMEIEIMPLKIMLNDILQKCSKLDLSKNKRNPGNLVLYKTIPCVMNQVEKYCKTEKNTKSNRVVYSFVFEG